jgi:formylmethanofuran dehydrogenase subunit E
MDYNDETFCEDCYADRYSSCEKCGDITESNDMHEHDDRLYCQDCFDILFTSSLMKEEVKT